MCIISKQAYHCSGNGPEIHVQITENEKLKQKQFIYFKAIYFFFK